jgi:hypothetical protein
MPPTRDTRHDPTTGSPNIGRAIVGNPSGIIAARHRIRPCITPARAYVRRRTHTVVHGSTVARSLHAAIASTAPAGRPGGHRSPPTASHACRRARARAGAGRANSIGRTVLLARWIRWVGWSPSIRLWACARFFASSWLRVRDKRSQSENGLIPCSGLQFVRLMIGRSINPSVVVSSMPAPSCSFLAGVVGYIDAVC